MAPHAYKVVNNHAHKISAWKFLYRIIRTRSPNLVGINGEVHSDLATLVFKNVEQLENFHGKSLRLQQEIKISGETVSPTTLFFQYMKAS